MSSPQDHYLNSANPIPSPTPTLLPLLPAKRLAQQQTRGPAFICGEGPFFRFLLFSLIQCCPSALIYLHIVLRADSLEAQHLRIKRSNLSASVRAPFFTYLLRRGPVTPRGRLPVHHHSLCKHATFHMYLVLVRSFLQDRKGRWSPRRGR
ncbi:uncharacterized protein EI90DRAFT_3046677 [Cantharellus anzutake]|uniref:uncharacterized protein n=1 Tax=Cantharellus anzutake TaxID=1750568 RepID=UPI0019041339|nr:uncharacterized protein EI90DRAFT_3046677 [Cantharellus anzutake]KAF8336656.1 hypothetical protein EI90DRAFT_3046677 [Cantharellus anzutake]